MNDDVSENMSAMGHSQIVPHQEALQKLADVPNLEQSLLTESKIEAPEEDNRKYKGSFRGQFKALVMKNYSLQKKQMGTNICQLLTPIVCLAMTLFIKSLALSHLNNVYTVTLDVPYLYNVPYNKIYGSQGPFKNKNPLSFDTCLQWYLYDFGDKATQDTRDFIGDAQHGMLSRIFPPVKGAKAEYSCNTAHMEGKLAPFFKRPVNGSINNQTYNNLRFLNTANFSAGKEATMGYLLQDGSFTFDEASKEKISVTIQTNDLRMTQYHRNNGITRYKVRVSSSDMKTVVQSNDGQLILLDLVSKAYISSLHQDVYMISGSQIMPETIDDLTFINKVISTSGASLFSIALSLLLPIFMHTIVHEKEERLREIMKMNGLKMKNYWLVNYLWSLGLYIISVSIFIVFGRFVLVTDFFVNTDIWVLILSMIGWGFSQVSLSFFFQNFLQKAKTALIAGYLLSIWTSIVAVTFSVAVFPYPQTFPLSMRLYPPFAFTRLMYTLSYKCSSSQCVDKFNELSPEMISCLIILYAGAVFFLLFGLYLDQVLPQEFGIRKGIFFFLQDCFANDQRKKKGLAGARKEDAKIKINDESNVFEEEEEREDEEDTGQEDEDVKRERAYIDSLPEENNRHPLLIKNLRKVYKAVGGKPPKVAVKNLSLHIKKGEFFGLLGPNGAGKTSLISMLTGLYPPENGNAWVGGYDIVNNIRAVHTQIGVCPQFDLVWPELTVREHLEFYARVRGVESKNEKKLVTKALKEVYLTRFADFKTKQLSGGMKRRLSVAIALVGDPKVIFLDEPTTGLDPENRRQLWDILVESRGKKAIVLTTHSMEEADVLCTRIGIITNGALRCIGNQTKLKGKYGGGYHLYINCHKDKHFNKHSEAIGDPVTLAEDCYEKLQKYIKELLPKSDLKSSFNGGFVYLVPTEGLEVSKLFEELESKKEEFGISDWGISQATLEDVFMEIVKSYAGKDSYIQ